MRTIIVLAIGGKQFSSSVEVKFQRNIWMSKKTRVNLPWSACNEQETIKFKLLRAHDQIKRHCVPKAKHWKGRVFGSFHGAAFFAERFFYDLFNKIFLKCITSGYEFTLIQYLLLYYHNTCSIIFNSEIS